MTPQRPQSWKILGLAALLGLPTLLVASSLRARAQNPAALNVAAPEFVGGPWLNTPGKKPVTLASRKGKVTLVQFWTFGCSNCLANIPAYSRLRAKYLARGVEMIGVHTPEFDTEKNPKNVARRAKELGIGYPILIDSKSRNWARWSQRYWPTIYLIDKQGRARARWIGELEHNKAGGEEKLSRLIEVLLQEPEAGAKQSASTSTPPASTSASTSASEAAPAKVVKSEEEWKKILSPAAFNVLRRKGTEYAFSGEYKSQGLGTYSCAGCGHKLFEAGTKFDSGTGWPSFWKALPAAVAEKKDTDHGMERVEVLCARCDGHLGHVFPDGPEPTGLRYCMNSVAMKFEAAKAKEADKAQGE
jgi:peptide-methionine (R)-S-oxide reductase